MIRRIALSALLLVTLNACKPTAATGEIKSADDAPQASDEEMAATTMPGGESMWACSVPWTYQLGYYDGRTRPPTEQLEDPKSSVYQCSLPAGDAATDADDAGKELVTQNALAACRADQQIRLDQAKQAGARRDKVQKCTLTPISCTKVDSTSAPQRCS